ncbi:hypothetical protein CSC80_05100 [Maribacter sp. 6B07]|uniref:tetratricopeptide repeat protein n=1 Tax=Maribacter sp. 6B07 TaxID=2045442 RepID=UPI000C0894E1|nr:tetratricopeptide repeat protein [Maribacter sp. 6B07]PHN94726.1 hypothetical protein CSC80_05100 [Maribacter sp. 6B07]
MKLTLLLILFTLTITRVHSQKDISIFGRVVVMNSKYETGNYEYIENSLIEIDCPSGNCKSQLTDSDGRFHLIVSDRPLLTEFKLKVTKPGYFVVDKSQLSVFLGQTDEILITLSTESQLERNRLIYENKLENYISKDIYKEKIYLKDSIITELSNLFINETIDNRELETRLLSKNNLISLISSKWSRTILDDKSSSYQEGFQYIQNGNFDLALIVFENLEIESRLKENKTTIQIADDNISDQNKIKNDAINQFEEDMSILLEKARLKLLKNDIKGSIADYKTGIKFSPDNLTFKLELASVYQILNNKKLVGLYTEVFDKEDDLFLKSCALNNLGGYYASNGEFKKAEKLLLEAKEIRANLYHKNTAKGNYIHTLINLSALYYYNKEYKHDLAFKTINQALNIAKDLYSSNNDSYFDLYIDTILTFIRISKVNLSIDEINDYYEKIDLLYKLHDKENNRIERIDFLNSYGIFLRDKIKDINKAREIFGTAINLYIDTNELDIFFEGNNNFTGHIDSKLIFLYKNVIRTLSPKKDSDYISELYYYIFMILDYYKENLPERYFKLCIPVILDNTLFQSLSGNYDKLTIQKNYFELEKMIVNELPVYEQLEYLALLNRQRSVFYFSIEAHVKALEYSIKSGEYFFELFNLRPQEWALDLLISDCNSIGIYIEKNDRELDSYWIKKLKKSKRRYLKNVQKEKIEQSRIDYVNSLIEILKK